MAFLPLPFFGPLFLISGAFAVASSSGHFQQQQFPSYYQYGGAPTNGDTRRTESESDGRRQQQQMNSGRGNRRFSSDAFSPFQQQMATAIRKDTMVFKEAELDVCLELCELDCFQVFAFIDRSKGVEEQGTMWQCSRLKPPARPFHEKVFSHIANASPFDYIIFAVVLLAVLLCLLCGCYQCCCRQNAQEGRHSNRSFVEERKTDSSTNFANHFGTTAKANHLGSAGGNGAERESLTNGGANQIGSDALIHPTPLSMGKNGGTGTAPLSLGRSSLPQQSAHSFAVGAHEQSAI
ncbi:hypothetical protein niasHT_024167 [Heterodera trifolii]|uniref:Transmembrane protein n=1 Tax=Heterodera trifolii TaxID=157864 RepID=A0ABD2JLZ1_9BILA